MSDEFQNWLSWMARIQDLLLGLRQDFIDPRRRSVWIRWELSNLGKEIGRPHRQDGTPDNNLRYLASKLRQELVATENATAA